MYRFCEYKYNFKGDDNVKCRNAPRKDMCLC